MRTIGLAHSAGETLARFLLDLFADHAKGKGEVRPHAHPYTLFADFKKKQLLQVKGSTLIIKNKEGLESLSVLSALSPSSDNSPAVQLSL